MILSNLNKSFLTLGVVAVMMSVPIISVNAQSPNMQTQYFSSIPDLPLMDGLTELPDETVSFDKPEGRIIEVYAMMELITRQDVLVFYRGTLPQLGWTPDGQTRFYRKDEYLDLEFIEGENGIILKFMISPAL